MSAAHTPGPWVGISELRNGGIVRIKPAYDDSFCIAIIPVGNAIKTKEADALLIAAAPELLAALKLYVLQDEFATDYGYGVGGEAKKTAEAAIAKATGGAA